MEQSKTRNHRARHKTRASLLSDKGLDAANHNRASGGGRRIFLTSPLIELMNMQLLRWSKAKPETTGQDTRLERHSYQTRDWMPRTIIELPADEEEDS